MGSWFGVICVVLVVKEEKFDWHLNLEKELDHHMSCYHIFWGMKAALALIFGDHILALNVFILLLLHTKMC